MSTPRIPPARSRSAPAATKTPTPTTVPHDAPAHDRAAALSEFAARCDLAGRPLALRNSVGPSSVADTPPLAWCEEMLPRLRGSAVALRCQQALRPVVFHGFRRVGFAFPMPAHRVIFVGLTVGDAPSGQAVDTSAPPFFVQAVAGTPNARRAFLDEALAWIDGEPSDAATPPAAAGEPIPSRNRTPTPDLADAGPLSALDAIH